MSALIDRRLEQAWARLRAGDISGASPLAEDIVRRAPGHPGALCLLGLTQLMTNRPQAAVISLQKAVDIDPDNGTACENLGLALMMVGRFSEAEPVLRRTTSLPGAPASVFMRLGSALIHQGRAAEAIPVLQRALAMDPANVDCLINLGQAYAQAGDAASAVAQFESILRNSPAHPDALFNLGVLALNADRLDEAEQRFTRAISANPRHPDACVNLGIILQRRERHDEALACFHRAVEIDPSHAAAMTNLGRSCALQGQMDEARAWYEKALKCAPGMVAAHEGLAGLCRVLGRPKEAASHLETVLDAEPENAEAWSQLANALFHLQSLDEAQTAARRALEIDPRNIDAHAVLVEIHFVRKDVDSALSAIKHGVDATGSTILLGMYARELKRTCDWREWAPVWERLHSELAQGGAVSSPFSLLYQPTTAQEQREYTERWTKAQYGAIRAQPLPLRDGKGRRLRIGYLSSDFHEHAAAYLIAEVLELHDRERFEIFAFSFGPEDHSPMRARLRQACEHFIDIAWDPDDIAARRIRDVEPDIIVDLKAHTLGARTGLLAQRLAPIQINWLGYPGTMGADFIDCIIGDDFIIPAAHEHFYRERVLRMPHCYQPNDRRRAHAEPLTRSQYGLPEHGFVFCCFNQAFKISPEIFARWMRLLRRVADSVLWLPEDNPRATSHLRAALRDGDIDPQRLVIAPRLPLAQHLARYRVADLALDTFPYTSHTTASDALWNECPLVGLCGETFASRVSGSILAACGLPDLITHTLDDYEALAFRLANDSTTLNRVRQRIADAKQSAPLFDIENFTRGLETLYSSAPDRR